MDVHTLNMELLAGVEHSLTFLLSSRESIETEYKNDLSLSVHGSYVAEMFDQCCSTQLNQFLYLFDRLQRRTILR